ncbi:trigger factor [Petralouisia muris]|uniref:Trigger factor n=1 Tax=Petralouisia muris TaxID=3032872 RepID=A0AC61S1T1_9FIRM|nr:trigger factor [Petralouisia muris]TGY97955.1 trigger factor [Petralouisia muris]
MKKKIMLLLCAVCTAALLGGCGTNQKENSDQKESTDKEETGGSEDQKEAIEYNAADYVELGEYMGLEVSLGSYEVTDEDVKNEVTNALLAYPVYEDTEKDTVEDGDFVNIDYEGLKDGEAFNGGTAQGAVLEIGSNSFIDGFEEGLIGVKVGEKVALDLTFPEGYQNAELAGQAVVFNVTVNKIVNKSDMTYDMLDDAFVEKNMSSQGYKTVEDFENGVRTQLEESKEVTKEQETQAAVIQKLKEVCKVKEFPDGLLDQRMDEYMARFNANLEAYGMKLEDYLSTSGFTEEDFNAQAEQLVTETLEGELIIEAIAQKEKIEISDEEFEEYKKSVVEEYGYESEEALLEQHGEEYVRNVYLREKTIDMLTKNAKITYGENSGEAKGAGEETSEEGQETGEKETSEEGQETGEKETAEE